MDLGITCSWSGYDKRRGNMSIVAIAVDWATSAHDQTFESPDGPALIACGCR